jgi:hypothetical protein
VNLGNDTTETYVLHLSSPAQDDELPYGWDEAEAEDGTTFYINHLDNTHHRSHPRDEIREREVSAAHAVAMATIQCRLTGFQYSRVLLSLMPDLLLISG